MWKVGSQMCYVLPAPGEYGIVKKMLHAKSNQALCFLPKVMALNSYPASIKWHINDSFLIASFWHLILLQP